MLFLCWLCVLLCKKQHNCAQYYEIKNKTLYEAWWLFQNAVFFASFFFALQKILKRKFILAVQKYIFASHFTS
jgi:hypothetical protein